MGQKRIEPNYAIYGWPPLMATALAKTYCGHDSKYPLLAAVAKGELTPAGVRNRSYVFTRESLDTWLRGKPVDAPATPGAAVPRTAAPVAENTNALERIDAIRRGSQG